MATQQIRFATAPDGVRLAWARTGEGEGRPLVKAANWLNHLEFDWQSPVWRHWLERLSENRTLIRYDERGNGLSDWDAAEMTLDAFVTDLETVVEAAGLEKFALLGISQGAAVGIAYAVGHPGRLTHMVLLGGYARGWARRAAPHEVEAREALLTLTRLGWGQNHPAFRQLWSSLYAPGATEEQMRWFNDLQHVSTSVENALRLQQAFGQIDVTALLPQVAVPTLVIHARGDGVIPFDEGRRIASLIPGAQFVELDTRNHILLPGEPAGERFIAEVDAFLGPSGKRTQAEAFPDRKPKTAGAGIAPGAVLGNYEVLEPLGRGGMGEVFRARDRRLGREVAIKLVSHVAPGESSRRRVLREARLAAGLNHPRICTVFDVADTADASFIVMELLEGRTLSALAAGGGLPAAQVAAYGAQVAEALEHAHARGVLHRDLKSANVMVDDSGRVKVVDFGLAAQLPSTEAETMTADSVYGSGSFGGTLAYMSPEALRARPLDERSDVWSLGVVLYELATGTLPFGGGTTFELTSSILERPPAPLAAGVSPRLARIIRRCLQKAPARRYRSASEVRVALQGVTRDKGLRHEGPVD